MHEIGYHQSSIFLTITYDDDHIPENQSLKKSDLQNFFKRLRKWYYPQRLKYYATGEYGEKTHRPHYHAIIFGLNPLDLNLYIATYNKGKPIWASQEIEKIWPCGNNTVGSVTYQSARYVADYTNKSDKTEDFYPRINPFNTMSQGIGKQWAIDNEDQIIQDMNIHINGHSVGIPKYYQKKLELDRDYFEEQAKYKILNDLEKYEDRAYRYGTTRFQEKIKARTARHKHNIKKVNIQGKGEI